MNQFSPRVRRLIALSIVVFLMSMIVSIALKPLWNAAISSIERLKDAQFELDRVRAIAKESSKFSESVVAAEEQSTRQYLQEGDSANGAIVSLQGSVSQLVKDSGLKLESMSAEPLRTKDSVSRLSINLKLSGSESQLMKMLGAIEGMPSLVTVDKLVISAQDLGQTVSGAPTTGVSVDMRVVGYWAARSNVKATPP